LKPKTKNLTPVKVIIDNKSFELRMNFTTNIKIQ